MERKPPGPGGQGGRLERRLLAEGRSGWIRLTRDDVATTRYLVIEGHRAVAATFDPVGGGDLTIAEALDAL